MEARRCGSEHPWLRWLLSLVNLVLTGLVRRDALASINLIFESLGHVAHGLCVTWHAEERQSLAVNVVKVIWEFSPLKNKFQGHDLRKGVAGLAPAQPDRLRATSSFL